MSCGAWIPQACGARIPQACGEKIAGADVAEGVYEPAARAVNAAATGTASPRALLVLSFAPGESTRNAAVSDLQATVQLLWKYGFQVDILDAYGEGGNIAECPHYQLHCKLDGSRYNLLVYYGHGDDSRWAFCLPQDGNWARYPDTPQGRDESRMFGDFRSHWQEEVTLAPNAMVLLRHTCYSQGLEAADMWSGARLLGAEEVLERVSEYSRTFLALGTGIRVYVALGGVGATPSYLESLFINYKNAIGEVTVSDLSASHRSGDGYQLLSGAHPYSAGMAFRKNRNPGGTNAEVWGGPAWAGDSGLTVADVCGMVPGDGNGDGDNTDLGEPCFPRDPKDAFVAEDTSYNFFPFLCVANPGGTGTWAQVTFYNEEGEYFSIFREVPAQSRITLDLNANRYLRNKNLSVRVRSVDDVPLLAERPMYFRYRGWMDGGSDVFGCGKPATCWYFAEGYASDAHPFHEYVCLGNFGERTARGTMTIYGGEGEPSQVSIEIPPRSRQTQYINAFRQGEVSVRVETDQPIVAERSMYFRYQSPGGGLTADGGHTKPGVGSLSDFWYFAEGHVSGIFDEWISLANPNEEKAVATVTYYTPEGKYSQRELTLAPRSRGTVLVNDAFRSEADVSVEVRADRPIACERAMYFNYNGACNDGHVSPGATGSSTRWSFAEGSVWQGIDEYVLLMNPGDVPAKVVATYIFGPGEGTHSVTHTVMPRQRVTVNVNRELAGHGSPSQVALELVSDNPVVAERAMYFDMDRGGGGREPIRGGHVSLGAQSAAAEWYFAEAYTGF